MDVLSGTFWSVIGRLFGVVIRSGSFILIARYLGPEKYGVVTYVLSISALMVVFVDAGISPSTARQVARYPKHACAYLRLASAMLSITLLTASVTLLSFAEPIADVLRAPAISLYAGLLALLIVGRLAQRFLMKMFEGLREMERYSKLLLLIDWLPWGTSISYILLRAPTAEQAVMGYVVGLMVANGIVLLGLRGVLPAPVAWKWRRTQREAGRVFRYALPLFFTAASFYVYSQSDIIMIQAFLSEEQVGVYGVAVRLIDTLHVPAVAVGSVLGAYFVSAPKMDTSSETESASRSTLFVRSTQGLLNIYLPMCVGLWFTGDALIQVLFGAEYEDAFFVALLYIPYLLLKALASTYSQALDYIGLARRRAVAAGLSAAANVGLNLWLIPTYGLLGAALTTQVTYLPLVLWYANTLRVHSNVDWPQVAAAVRPVLYATVTMGVVLFLMDHFLTPPLFIAIGAGVLVYGTAALAFKAVPRQLVAFLRR